MEYLICFGIILLADFLLNTYKEISELYDFKITLEQYNKDFPEHQIPIPVSFKKLNDLYSYVCFNGVEMFLLATATRPKDIYKEENNDETKTN